MSRRKSIFLSSQETQSNLKQLDEFSNEIDQNLRTLAYIHPFTQTEKTLLVKDAFVKPNKSAFHHVVHYLLMIINAANFRKRFRWPILSLSDESDFRTQTIAYFNECQSNFKWNFGPFKMQTVLFPGGIELMKIIIELSKLAMNTVLKQHDCIDLINARCITLQEAHAKLQAAEDSFERLELFRSKVQSMATPLKEKAERLNEFLDRILSGTSFTRDMITPSFLSSWEQKLHEIIDEKVMPMFECIEKTTSECESFEQCLMTTKPRQLQFDVEKMGALGLLIKSQHFDAQIDYDKLLEWFENAMPELINATYCEPPWSISKLLEESQALNRLIVRADELLERIDILSKDIEFWHIPGKGATQAKCTMLSYLNEKLILTPEIGSKTKKNRRIVIWEAVPAVDSPAIAQRKRMVEDDLDTFCNFGDYSSVRSVTAKLDPLSVLNNVMQRTGSIKCKSPHRSLAHSSPKGVYNSNNNNNTPEFTSTAVRNDKHGNRIALSPMRKALF